MKTLLLILMAGMVAGCVSPKFDVEPSSLEISGRTVSLPSKDVMNGKWVYIDPGKPPSYCAIVISRRWVWYEGFDREFCQGMAKLAETKYTEAESHVERLDRPCTPETAKTCDVVGRKP